MTNLATQLRLNQAMARDNQNRTGSEYQKIRNLKKRHYWYMARYVLAGAFLGYVLFDSVEVVVVPTFFFLLYVIDDHFGTVAMFIVMMLGMLGGIGWVFDCL